jgi:ABC-type dipeptide/oligopeptide/nickel transport system permease component
MPARDVEQWLRDHSMPTVSRSARAVPMVGAGMILLFAFAVTLVTVPLCGGRLSRLGHLQLRHSWLIISALAMQTLVISVIPTSGRDRATRSTSRRTRWRPCSSS